MTRKRKIVIFILILLTVAAAALVVISASSDRLDGFFRALGTPVRAIQKGITRIGDDWGKRASVRREYAAVQEEIERLTRENEELRQKEREYTQIKAENEELRRLLDMRDRTEGYELLQAAVITRDVTDWFNEFTIDLGTRDGVVNGTVVITSYGLVGIVYNAGSSSAKVRCIIDEQSELMCRIRRNDELLRVRGTSNENFTAGLKADRIARTAALYVGDEIITANSGGVYPPGIVVGVVTEVGVDEDGNRFATVRSDVNFTSLTTVTVMVPKAAPEPDNK